MSNYSDINGDVRANLSQEGFRHYNGTSTAAGAADGTTIIDTALPGIDDSWNNAQCLILSGDFSEMTPKEVEGFTESSGTLTFTNNPFQGQIAGSVNYELYDGGAWSTASLRKFIMQAAIWVIKRARPSDLVNYEIEIQKDGAIIEGRGVVSLPTNMINHNGKNRPFTKRIKVKSGDYPFELISDDDWKFMEDDLDAGVISETGEDKSYYGYISGRNTSGDANGNITYLPAVSESFIFTVIQKPSFDASGNWKIPESLHDPIAKVATAIALQAHSLDSRARNWLGLSGFSN